MDLNLSVGSYDPATGVVVLTHTNPAGGNYRFSLMGETAYTPSNQFTLPEALRSGASMRFQIRDFNTMEWGYVDFTTPSTTPPPPPPPALVIGVSSYDAATGDLHLSTANAQGMVLFRLNGQVGSTSANPLRLPANMPPGTVVTLYAHDGRMPEVAVSYTIPQPAPTPEPTPAPTPTNVPSVPFEFSPFFESSIGRINMTEHVDWAAHGIEYRVPQAGIMNWTSSSLLVSANVRDGRTVTVYGRVVIDGVTYSHSGTVVLTAVPVIVEPDPYPAFAVEAFLWDEVLNIYERNTPQGASVEVKVGGLTDWQLSGVVPVPPSFRNGTPITVYMRAILDGQILKTVSTTVSNPATPPQAPPPTPPPLEPPPTPDTPGFSVTATYNPATGIITATTTGATGTVQYMVLGLRSWGTDNTFQVPMYQRNGTLHMVQAQSSAGQVAMIGVVSTASTAPPVGPVILPPPPVNPPAPAPVGSPPTYIPTTPIALATPPASPAPAPTAPAPAAPFSVSGVLNAATGVLTATASNAPAGTLQYFVLGASMWQEGNTIQIPTYMRDGNPLTVMARVINNGQLAGRVETTVANPSIIVPPAPAPTPPGPPPAPRPPLSVSLNRYDAATGELFLTTANQGYNIVLFRFEGQAGSTTANPLTIPTGQRTPGTSVTIYANDGRMPEVPFVFTVPATAPAPAPTTPTTTPVDPPAPSTPTVTPPTTPPAPPATPVVTAPVLVVAPPTVPTAPTPVTNPPTTAPPSFAITASLNAATGLLTINASNVPAGTLQYFVPGASNWQAGNTVEIPTYLRDGTPLAVHARVINNNQLAGSTSTTVTNPSISAPVAPAPVVTPPVTTAPVVTTGPFAITASLNATTGLLTITPSNAPAGTISYLVLGISSWQAENTVPIIPLFRNGNALTVMARVLNNGQLVRSTSTTVANPSVLPPATPPTGPAPARPPLVITLNRYDAATGQLYLNAANQGDNIVLFRMDGEAGSTTANPLTLSTERRRPGTIVRLFANDGRLPEVDFAFTVPVEGGDDLQISGRPDRHIVVTFIDRAFPRDTVFEFRVVGFQDWIEKPLMHTMNDIVHPGQPMPENYRFAELVFALPTTLVQGQILTVEARARKGAEILTTRSKQFVIRKNLSLSAIYNPSSGEVVSTIGNLPIGQSAAYNFYFYDPQGNLIFRNEWSPLSRYTLPISANGVPIDRTNVWVRVSANVAEYYLDYVTATNNNSQPPSFALTATYDPATGLVTATAQNAPANQPLSYAFLLPGVALGSSTWQAGNTFQVPTDKRNGVVVTVYAKAGAAYAGPRTVRAETRAQGLFRFKASAAAARLRLLEFRAR